MSRQRANLSKARAVKLAIRHLRQSMHIVRLLCIWCFLKSSMTSKFNVKRTSRIYKRNSIVVFLQLSACEGIENVIAFFIANTTLCESMRQMQMRIDDTQLFFYIRHSDGLWVKVLDRGRSLKIFELFSEGELRIFRGVIRSNLRIN